MIEILTNIFINSNRNIYERKYDFYYYKFEKMISKSS